MKHKLVFLLCMVCATVVTAASPNPYIGQEGRDIKAMSPEDVQSYLEGKGMGFAKAAELNGYPGPSHVLALASELHLSREQKELTQSLFAAMQVEAVKYGRQLIEEERNLDRLFATKQVTIETLKAALTQIGNLQAKVRAAHLEAHLAQLRILTPEQTVLYSELRGYTSQAASNREHHHH